MNKTLNIAVIYLSLICVAAPAERTPAAIKSIHVYPSNLWSFLFFEDGSVQVSTPSPSHPGARTDPNCFNLGELEKLIQPSLTEIPSPDTEVQVNIWTVGDPEPSIRFATDTKVFKKLFREVLAKAVPFNEVEFRHFLTVSPLLDIPADVLMRNGYLNRYKVGMVVALSMVIMLAWWLKVKRRKMGKG